MPVFGACFMGNFALEKICDQIVHFFISSRSKIYKKDCFFTKMFDQVTVINRKTLKKKSCIFCKKSHFLKITSGVINEKQ